MRKIIFLFLFLVAVQHSKACDNSTFSIANQTVNPDGSTTYTFDITIDLGALDAPFFGFTLSFNSSDMPPQIVIGGTYPTTNSISDAGLECGSLNGETLTALSGADINSLNNDTDWSIYEGLSNVISYEDGSSFGSANSDICLSIQVTVQGCVENIELNAHVNNGGLCIYNLTTGKDCAAGLEASSIILKEVIKVMDLMGREVPFSNNTPLLFIFEDGSVHRTLEIAE